MKSLVLFYSYSGNTKKIAEQLADKEKADIFEIKDLKRPGKFKAYTAGCFAAMRGKAWPVTPVTVDIKKYGRIIMLAPIWAGSPAPAFNAALDLLPSEKAVSFIMVSGSGQSSCKEKLKEIVESKDCTMEGFEDVKA